MSASGFFVPLRKGLAMCLTSRGWAMNGLIRWEDDEGMQHLSFARPSNDKKSQIIVRAEQDSPTGPVTMSATIAPLDDSKPKECLALGSAMNRAERKEFCAEYVRLLAGRRRIQFRSQVLQAT